MPDNIVTTNVPLAPSRKATSDTAEVTFHVYDIRPGPAPKIAALATAEVVIEGIAFHIDGLQVIRGRYKNGDTYTVRLPHFRGRDGNWHPAIALPDELRDALGATVMEACVDEGLVPERVLEKISGAAA